MNNTTDHPRTSLYFREGSADKEYHAAIQARDGGFIVSFSYGRRGSTLTHGTKTTRPVPLIEARTIYQKLVASKTAKGYQETEASTEGRTIWNSTGTDGPCLICPPPTPGDDSGVRCQLLNSADPGGLARLLANLTHCLQIKYDGRRVLVRKQGNTITGINRRGLVIELPDAIRQAAAALPADCLIDGEAVGETLHAFDLLEAAGDDLRPTGYKHRHTVLLWLLENAPGAIQPVRSASKPTDKLAMYKSCRQNACEGVVFKEIDAPFTPGRPNSGGTQLKYKFVESASFIVIGINARRSIALGLYTDAPELVRAGNVTIPPNHEVPEMRAVVEVKYLHAFRASGSVYQPVYVGKRDDIPRNECLTSQLKYKSEAA